MNLPYSISMFWTNSWQPTDRVQRTFFEKPLQEVGSSHLNASFGTFCVQNFQKNSKWTSFSFKNKRFYRFQTFFKDSLWLQTLTNLDAKGAKRSVKTWTTNFYKSFPKNIWLYISSRLSKIRSKNIRMLYPGRFILVESVPAYQNWNEWV